MKRRTINRAGRNHLIAMLSASKPYNLPCEVRADLSRRGLITTEQGTTITEREAYMWFRSTLTERGRKVAKQIADRRVS